MARGAAQAEPEVTPDATPQIQLVNPAQASPGDEVTVTVTGSNFSAGAYVSFSDPAVHVVSTRRVSPTKLETKLAVSTKAKPGALTLYVSNPASTVAETAFTIGASTAPPQPVPAPPAPQLPPVNEVQPAQAGTPEVSIVDPPSAGRGGGATVKVQGKNFAPQAKVAFANPGIRVLGTQVAKTTELTVEIQIAADAATGVTSLYVINPGDREAEAQFEVTTAAPGKTPTVAEATGTKASKASAKTGAAASKNAPEQTFSVYNLGNAASILQSGGKKKGTLVLSGGKVRYEEEGQEVFSAPLTDIKEVEENSIFGVKSGTFHIFLNDGKTYNFMAASLRAPDTEAIVNAFHDALK